MYILLLCNIPVSYTHLDVYKRQLRFCVKINYYRIKIKTICNCQVDKDEQIILNKESCKVVKNPVSYTHLYYSHWWKCVMYTEKEWLALRQVLIFNDIFLDTKQYNSRNVFRQFHGDKRADVNRWYERTFYSRISERFYAKENKTFCF